jgi:hypothetical protein
MLDLVNWLIDLHSLSTLAEATEESQWDRWRRYWPSESSSHSQEAKDLKMKYSSERQTERDPPNKHGADFRFYPYFTPLQLLRKKSATGIIIGMVFPWAPPPANPQLDHHSCRPVINEVEVKQQGHSEV